MFADAQATTANFKRRYKQHKGAAIIYIYTWNDRNTFSTRVGLPSQINVTRDSATAVHD